MFKLSCARHSSTSPMAKKMLRLEEIKTQMVLELPDRQLMRRFDYIINAATYTLSSPGKELDSWIAL